MARPDLVVRNATVVTPVEVFRATIGIEDGRISAIGTDATVPRGEVEVDASGLVVLPGVIDEHVHFREPGMEHKEDFGTGSTAAAAGGVTTVLDMPNTVPPTVDGESFDLKLERASAKSVVDFGLYGGYRRGRWSLEELTSRGIVGLKLYLSETTGISEFPDDHEVIELMRRCARADVRVGVHAEDGRMIAALREALRAAGRSDPMAHLEARPVEAEVVAVARVLTAAWLTGAKVHVFHVTSSQCLQLAERFKAMGVDVTLETCPHYLILDGDEALRRLGNVAKVNPPIRGRGHAEALWEGIRRGLIDAVGSDHAPHLPEEKRSEDVWTAPSGFPGVETMLPLMLDRVNRGDLALGELVRLVSENPARIWGLYPRKGAIAVGSDADLTVVDLREERRISSEALHSRSKVTPFEGMKARGWPVYAVVRGEIVAERGEVVGGAGHGVLVVPKR
ncbi:MAG: allantoinase AllB [Candidatus Caldarchaeales archaeon]